METFLSTSGPTSGWQSKDQSTTSNSQDSSHTAEAQYTEGGSGKSSQSPSSDLLPVSAGSAPKDTLMKDRREHDTRSGSEPVPQEEGQGALRTLPGVLDWKSQRAPEPSGWGNNVLKKQ
jgi:hypothetical protein